MKSSAKFIMAAGFVAASIIAAAELKRRSRDGPDPSPPVARQPDPAETAGETVQPGRPVQPGTPDKQYQAIAERNVFRPLVSPPRQSEEGEVPGGLVAGTAVGAQEEDTRAQSAGPGGTTDPLAGLALTGITQVGDRLRALLEHVSTRTGRYVSVGEEFRGFRVVDIRADSVVLEKDGKQGTLSMGAKRLSLETQAKPAPMTEKVEDAPAPTPKPTAPPDRAREMREGFGEEMLSWAESMSLPELERMYSQYGDYLSPQQRAQAEAYLRERRARGR